MSVCRGEFGTKGLNLLKNSGTIAAGWCGAETDITDSAGFLLCKLFLVNVQIRLNIRIGNHNGTVGDRPV